MCVCFTSNILNHNSFTLSFNSIRTMNTYTNFLEPVPVSHSGSTRSDFEFPSFVSRSVPNDVVFCGKVITCQTKPGPEQQTGTKSENPFSRSNRFTAGLRSPSVKEIQCRRSGSCGKRYNGMFGTVKFPLQMDLSDIKMRQERREPMPLSNLPAENDGGDSCWELIRPLRRRGKLLTLLAKASFGCIPSV